MLFLSVDDKSEVYLLYNDIMRLNDIYELKINTTYKNTSPNSKKGTGVDFVKLFRPEVEDKIDEILKFV
jgi:hypothetical protein